MGEIHQKIKEWRDRNDEEIDQYREYHEDPPPEMMYDAFESLIELCKLIDDLSGHKKDD